jgi:hypothetical protein
VRENKKLWENLKLVSDTYRTLLSYKINIEVLSKELEDTRNKVLVYTTTLEELVTKSAVTVASIEDTTIRPELLIAGPEQFTGQMRDVLNQNAKL